MLNPTIAILTVPTVQRNGVDSVPYLTEGQVYRIIVKDVVGYLEVEKVHTSFLIPIREDQHVGNGQLHHHRRWNLLQDELFMRFGAFTKAPGLYEGVYSDQDTGERIPDLSREYRVDIEDDRLSDLKAFLSDFVGPLFRQKCVYLVVQGRSTLITSNLERLNEFS